MRRCVVVMHVYMLCFWSQALEACMKGCCVAVAGTVNDVVVMTLSLLQHIHAWLSIVRIMYWSLLIEAKTCHVYGVVIIVQKCFLPMKAMVCSSWRVCGFCTLLMAFGVFRIHLLHLCSPFDKMCQKLTCKHPCVSAASQRWHFRSSCKGVVFEAPTLGTCSHSRC